VLPLLTTAAFAFPITRPDACSPAILRTGQREIHLISTSPAGEPFSYIGHAALWVRDPAQRLDHIFEFGAINSARQEPLSALLLGNLKCWWLRGSIDKRIGWYRKTGRRVIAQPFVLPDDLQDQLFERIYSINGTMSQSYIFDWRTRNCATEIRDILDDILDGQLSTALSDPAPLTPRAEVLRYLSAHPWAWLGWHQQAGPDVDVPITRWQAAFIPERLTESLMDTPITLADGTTAPILGTPCLLNKGTHDWAGPKPPDWNTRLGGIGLLLAGILGGAGRADRKALRRVAGGVLMGVGLLGGLLGTASIVLWLVSALTVYGPNENWWITNPATFLLIPAGRAVIKGEWAGWLRQGVVVLLALASVGVILDLTGLTSQDNAGFFALMWPILAATVWLSRR
jgi:hypothetical protein